LLDAIAEFAMGGRLRLYRMAMPLALFAGWLASVAAPAFAQGLAEADALNKQIGELSRQGRYAEATEIAKGSLAIQEKALGPDHPQVGTALNQLGLLYRDQGRFTEAEPLYRRSLTIYEMALGPEHPWVAAALNNLASLYHDQGRYTDAEPLFRRSLSIRETVLGPDHPDVGQSLNNLAELYRAQGRYAEAEPLNKSTVSIFEKALGPGHPDVGIALNNLAELYHAQGRYADAEPLYKRSLAIREKALGPDHPAVGTALNNLAGLYQDQGRYAEAEPLYKRDLAMEERALGPDHPAVGGALNNLAELYRAQGRFAEAEPLVKRNLAIQEKALGFDHPYVGMALNNLAGLYNGQGRYADAEPLFMRSLAVREMTLGPDHPDVGAALNNLAGLYFAQRDWARAAEFWRRSTSIIVRRAHRGTAEVGQALTGKRKGEAELLSFQFWGLVKAVHRLAPLGGNADTSFRSEMFQTAQWAQASEAAASLAQMAARGAKGDIKLARLVRERQDLVEEWQRRDQMHSASMAQDPGKRDHLAETPNVTRLAAIDAQIAEIDTRLLAEFPDYATLAKPTPLSMEDVQAHLGADEALVLFLDTHQAQPLPEETFIWIVTKTDTRWLHSDLGTPALGREVAALRCGLDAGLWDEGAVSARCSEWLKTAPQRDAQDNVRTETLPFEQARAYALYKALFGQAKDMLRNKHLLIVPSGPLTQLPFHVLVTAPVSDASDYRGTKWLARQNVITVLPAVSSLKALRRVARLSAATRPMLGVGNPLLDGDSGNSAMGGQLG
jgi:tetratricopeptide (TPR) repeat protein